MEAKLCVAFIVLSFTALVHSQGWLIHIHVIQILCWVGLNLCKVVKNITVTLSSASSASTDQLIAVGCVSTPFVAIC